MARMTRPLARTMDYASSKEGALEVYAAGMRALVGALPEGTTPAVVRDAITQYISGLPNFLKEVRDHATLGEDDVNLSPDGMVYGFNKENLRGLYETLARDAQSNGGGTDVAKYISDIAPAKLAELARGFGMTGGQYAPSKDEPDEGPGPSNQPVATDAEREAAERVAAAQRIAQPA